MVDHDLLAPDGWTEAVANEYDSLIDDGCVLARVIRMDRGECALPIRRLCAQRRTRVCGAGNHR